MSTALVIGNYRATLVVIRSLAAAGHEVILGVAGNTHGNDRSRFVSGHWRHPALDAAHGAFGKALCEFLDRHDNVRWIVPVTEQAVVHFARHRYALPESVTIAAAKPELVEVCQSKEKTLAAAASAGVPVAPYTIADSLDSLTRAAADIGYPCIVRPLVAPVRLLGRKALILASPAALRSTIRVWPAEHERLMVQRYVRAPRHNLYFVAQNGRIASCVQVLILRTDRADGTGLAVEGMTVPQDERLLAYCRDLARELDYTGVGCAQFLVDPDSEEASFLEINPRLGANCAIIQHCGVDLPLCMCLLADGQPLDAANLPSTYPAGRRYAWMFGDFAGLVHEIVAHRLGIGQAAAWLARLTWNSLCADVHLTFDRRDPLPTLTLFARRTLGRRNRKRAPGRHRDNENRAAQSRPAKVE